jgi:hypothetical protein
VIGTVIGIWYLSIFGCIFKIFSILSFVLRAIFIFACFRSLVFVTILHEYVNKAQSVLGLAVLFMFPWGFYLCFVFYYIQLLVVIATVL